MDHDNVVRAHLPERYFLGELPPAERDEFEEHLADCSACRKEVAAIDAFAANAVAVFENEERAKVLQPAAGKGWLDFLRPRPIRALAFSGVLNFALLLVIAAGVTRMSRENRPGILEIHTVRPPARSASDQVIEVPVSRQFALLQFDLSHSYDRYTYTLDQQVVSVEKPAESPTETLALRVPITGLKAGEHSLQLTGWNGQSETEIARCTLRLVPENQNPVR